VIVKAFVSVGHRRKNTGKIDEEKVLAVTVDATNKKLSSTLPGGGTFGEWGWELTIVTVRVKAVPTRSIQWREETGMDRRLILRASRFNLLRQPSTSLLGK
jgi:type VI protein secretion system component VasA